jgi:protein phosphatase 1 regulatory subunit 42
MDPPLGGRLARRPMDPVAEAERRMQQEKLYSLDLNKIRCGDDKRTTLMVKNIPNKYTQKMLLALVEERFRGMFDFFYLPIDFKNKCNVGYAFINMVRPEYIIPLVEELHGKKWPKFNSEKICHIAYGRIQGKAALVQHFQNSSLLHEDKRCRPILFHSNGALAGEVEQFPGTLPSPTLTPPPGGLPATGPPASNGGAASVPLMAAAPEGGV